MNPETTALLLVDYQRALCDRGGAVGGATGLAEQAHARGVLANAARCLGAARDAGVFVAHARVAFDTSYVNRTNRSERFGGFERNRLLGKADDDAWFCDEVTPVDGELVVGKGCVDPFVGTGLREALTARGIRDVNVGGVATNFAVESAVRHGADIGFSMTVLDDCCAAYDEDMHRFFVGRILPVFGELRTAAQFVRELEGGLGHGA